MDNEIEIRVAQIGEIVSLFEREGIESIVKSMSKVDLIKMYWTVTNRKPLTEFNKTEIAYNLYYYIIQNRNK